MVWANSSTRAEEANKRKMETDLKLVERVKGKQPQAYPQRPNVHEKDKAESRFSPER